MTNHYDAIILGGGAFGAFSAYFLAKLGKRVALVERGLIGAESSGANFGGLRLQGRSVLQYPLSLLAQQYWEVFEQEFGESCQYTRCGMVYFSDTEAGRDRLMTYAEHSRACGLEIEILRGSELRRALPWLASTETMLASRSDRCAIANPRLVAPIVARALLRAGGDVFEQCGPAIIHHSGDGFYLKGPGLQPISAPILVNATGAWAQDVCVLFNEEAPLFSAGPPQFVTEPLPPIMTPAAYAIEGDLILRQTARGNFIFAGYPRTLATDDGTHTFVPPAKTLAGMRAVTRHIPALRHAEIIRVWSGVEGYLPDMLPVIGPGTGTPGLFHAFGGSGGGFQIAPAVGRCLAELIIGSPPSCDLAPYSIARFASAVKESEKIQTEFDHAG